MNCNETSTIYFPQKNFLKAIDLSRNNRMSEEKATSSDFCRYCREANLEQRELELLRFIIYDIVRALFYIKIQTNKLNYCNRQM